MSSIQIVVVLPAFVPRGRKLFRSEESALSRALVRIIAPLAGPGLVSVTVLCFVTAWNEYLLASVFLRSQNLLTVGVGLQLFSQQLISNWGPVMAGAAVAMMPSQVIYLAFQRYFVTDILAGAIEG